MSLRVASATLREISLTLVEPFEISSGTVSERRILLLELVDVDGLSGWSECVAGERPNYSPETVDTAWHALLHWLLPAVLGVGFERPQAVDARLAVGVRGHLMARAALEMGFWALAAAQTGVSLATLLGGARRQIATGISIGVQPHPAELVAKVQAALSSGYRKAKIKIKPGADLEYLRAVRDAVGDEAPLMADANSAYTLDDVDHLTQLDPLGLTMIEQPLGWDDLVRHAELQRHLRTPICLDESITSVERVEDMLALGSGRIVNIKPGRVGGFTAAKAIHDRCLAADIPVWCGGMLESGVGRTHNVALASLPGFTLPGDVSPSARYWDQDIVRPEWTMNADGMVTVPTAEPGLGVVVDRDRIENLTNRALTLHASV